MKLFITVAIWTFDLAYAGSLFERQEYDVIIGACLVGIGACLLLKRF